MSLMVYLPESHLWIMCNKGHGIPNACYWNKTKTVKPIPQWS